MKSQLLRRRGVIAGGLLAAGLPRPARARDAGTISIGVLNDQTGPYSDSGGPGSVLSAQMAVNDFGGTIHGKRIEILSADTHNKPDVAASVARQWYDSGVDVIVDLPVTPIAAAVQEIAREKIRSVMISAAVVTEFTSKTCAPISTHWVDDTHSMVSATTRAAVEDGGRKWFFVTVDYSFGHGLQASATALIEAAGRKVIGNAVFPIGNTDFVPKSWQREVLAPTLLDWRRSGTTRSTSSSNSVSLRQVRAANSGWPGFWFISRTFMRLVCLCRRALPSGLVFIGIRTIKPAPSPGVLKPDARPCQPKPGRRFIHPACTSSNRCRRLAQAIR